MRYAIIENGKVINVASSDSALANNWVQSNTAQIDDLYDGKKFTKPTPDAAAEWIKVRAQRDKLLSESDWTMISDAPTNKTNWSTYRQALRDIPETQSNPFNISWPQQPA